MTATRRSAAIATVLVTLAAGCSSGGGDGGGGTPSACASGEYCGSIPLSVDACADTEHWPLTVDSMLRPLSVHYSRFADEARAEEMVTILEHAWDVQVDTLGFTAPLDDEGHCGADGRYDVFFWRGVDGAYVDSVAENPATSYDDYSTYMAIDPTGEYGAELLDTTLTHEFNHAVQASDDWWESALIFEMSATFVESLVYPEQDDYFYVLEDFQRHPEWSLFYDDNYRTWYMYGAAMYLHFLYQRYFPDDPAFIARIWHDSRSEPTGQRPDYIDSIRSLLLTERGVEFDDAVVEFMQWRWFVAEQDDGAHFSQGTDWPATVAFLEVDASEPSLQIDISAMLYGAGYVRVTNNQAAERNFSVDVENPDSGVVWRLTTVESEPVAGSISVPPLSSLDIVAVALPATQISSQTLDFDTRTMVLGLGEL